MADNTSMLNDLIETSKDGENGFRSAAEDAKSAELKATFLRRAEDCAKGASELQQLVARMGGKPEQGGSVAGAMHRGWMDLKAKVTHRDDLAGWRKRGRSVRGPHATPSLERTPSIGGGRGEL